jgi:hypothetical protein
LSLAFAIAVFATCAASLGYEVWLTAFRVQSQPEIIAKKLANLSYFY